MVRGAAAREVPERVRQVGYDDAPSAWDSSATHDAPWGMLLERALWQRAKFERLQERFAEELEQSKLAAMKELAYGAGHEINNPLANIGTRAQALLRHERDPERRRQLITINKQVFRAHAMIADMMLFAKPPSLNYERIDVGQLLERLLRELEDELRDRDIRLQVVATPGLVLEGDANQLMVALRAICQNSVDALHHGGAIWVTAEVLVSDREPEGDEEAGEEEAREEEAGRDEMVFEVSDDGPGIPPGLREKLFDPFFSGREAGRGLGFGLSKAWRIIREHAGRIDVLSGGHAFEDGAQGEDGGSAKGATFRVVLPRTRR
jgi:signal transduction histidine kinase